jgi:Leucine-rich repeat (LRR) protein
MSESLTLGIIQAKAKTDNLKIISNLNLFGVGFEDVSILRQMTNLEVVSLPVNRISSLRDFQELRKLRELSVRKNNIKNLNEIRFLSGCKNLTNLWMTENPCADHPMYRIFVAAVLPQLSKLDNVEISQNERAMARNLDLSDPRLG